jgi:hypothetical protein
MQILAYKNMHSLLAKKARLADVTRVLIAPRSPVDGGTKIFLLVSHAYDAVHTRRALLREALPYLISTHAENRWVSTRDTLVLHSLSIQHALQSKADNSMPKAFVAEVSVPNAAQTGNERP